MAIINSILRGQLKGRIGNQWFAHARSSKGNPVTRVGTINENPTNPKTAGQMTQRAKFANAVKFYQRATANFFRFAFEDKKPNESDYNAFMRHNISRSLVLQKELVDTPSFPALGQNWLLSQGSLNRRAVELSFSARYVDFGEESKSALVSISDLSKLFIDNGYAIEGDIVTFVVVTSPIFQVVPLASIKSMSVPLWHIAQFIVNTSDFTTIDNIKHVGDNQGSWSVANESPVFSFDSGSEENSIWAAVVVTRMSRNGLKCTTTYLEGNEPAKLIEESAAAGTWDVSSTSQPQTGIDNSIISWNVGDTAILKGEIAVGGSSSGSSSTPTADAPVIEYCNTHKIPTTVNHIYKGLQNYVVVQGKNLGNLTMANLSATGCVLIRISANEAGDQAAIYFNADAQAEKGSISLKESGTTATKTICSWTAEEKGASDTDA